MWNDVVPCHLTVDVDYGTGVVSSGCVDCGDIYRFPIALLPVYKAALRKRVDCQVVSWIERGAGDAQE